MARSVEGVEPVVEDLRERALPLLDEPVVPTAAEGQTRREHTGAWAETVSGGGRSASDQLGHALRVVGADPREPGVAIPLSFGAYGAGGRPVDAERALAGSTDDLRAAPNALVAVGDGVGA